MFYQVFLYIIYHQFYSLFLLMTFQDFKTLGMPIICSDDTKLFKQIECIEDPMNFQVDFDNFYQWYYINVMCLNINKRFTISNSLKKTTSYFNYSTYKLCLTH